MQKVPLGDTLISYLSISSFLVTIYINTFHAFEDTDMGDLVLQIADLQSLVVN